jgi:AcrR family transcriptional regulator
MQGTGRGQARQQRSARIELTALRLFRSRGYDNVTVEDICTEAGVAPATFYRHFRSKDEVVFSYRNAFNAAMWSAVDASADVPEAARLTAVMSQYADFLESQSEMLALRDGLVLGHSGLLQKTLMIQREVEATLASGLARLRGLPEPDATARLEAGLGLLVLRLAVRSWQAEGGGPLPAAFRRVLESLRSLVCDPQGYWSTLVGEQAPDQ